jgi:hypothetical protein
MGDGVKRKPRAGTRPVLDDDLLTPDLRQPIDDNAGRQIGAATGRKADDEFYDAGWISIRACRARQRRERGSTGQLQKAAARKFHDVPLR